MSISQLMVKPWCRTRVGKHVDPLAKGPRLDIEPVVAEERVVQRRLGRRARAIDDGIDIGPPAPGGVDKPMAGGPDIRMLPGTDLVVHSEDVEVLLGAEVEHPQVAGGHEAD